MPEPSPVTPVIIPLRLPFARIGFGAAACGAVGVGILYLSFKPTLVRPRGDLIAQRIGGILMSVPQTAGVWPLPALMGALLLGLTLWLVWGLTARRELTMDSNGVRWRTFLPWSTPRELSWTEIAEIERNAAGDYLVFVTSSGRQLLPAFWLPPGTLLERVIREAKALQQQAHQ
jgi:hypothetical protein